MIAHLCAETNASSDFGVQAQNITLTDSLEKLLKTEKEQTKKVNILNKLCWQYRKNDSKKAIEYGNNALELAIKIKYKQGLADALNNLGSAYSGQGDYDKALKCYHKALEIRRKTGGQIEIAIIQHNIGGIYNITGNFKKALQLYLHALRIFEDKSDNKNIAMAYNSIGNLYHYQQNMDIALKYYLKALEIYKKDVDYKIGLNTCLNNIAACYFNQGRFEKALDYFIQSLKNFEATNNRAGIAMCLSNIASLYIDQGKYNKAKEPLLKSLEINKELGLKADIAINLHNLGNLSAKLKRYKMAETYYLNSLKLCEQTGYIHLVQANYKNMAECYAYEGFHKKAYQYIGLYYEIKDSLFSEKSTRQIAEIQQKYEKEKKDRALEIQQAKFKRKSNLQNLFIFAGILIFFVIVILVGRFKINPQIAKYTGGLPLPTLSVNAVLALFFALINILFEKMIKRRLIKRN